VAPPENVTIERQPSDADCVGHAGSRDRDALVTERPLPAPGTSLRLLPGPVFTEQLAFALDGAAADPALLARLDAILADMRADGTLARLSVKDFGVDLSTRPAP
jgi:ABC-type amino acid transport substrate-binding protein